jgi:hypothetical protein
MSWAAVIVGGAALVGSAVSSNAAKKGAKAQAHSADAATEEQRRQYDQTRADMLPWQQTGQQSLSQLALEMGLPGVQQQPLSYDDWLAANPSAQTGPATIDNATGRVIGDGRAQGINNMRGGFRQAPLTVSGQPGAPADRHGEYDQYVKGLSAAPAPTGREGYLSHDFTLADFEKDPGYQFRLDEGTKALERSAAARGGLMSGGTGKALERYGQDSASAEYSNAYNRFNNDRTTRFNRLSAVAGTGQTAATTLGSLGAASANNISDLATQRGNAIAGGTIGQANAVNGGISTLADFYTQQQYMKKFPNYSGGGTGGYAGGGFGGGYGGGVNGQYTSYIQAGGQTG